jgi:hypothetical protein
MEIKDSENTHLIVKAALGLEMLEELGVRFAAPERK